jgi:hypothetical protein
LGVARNAELVVVKVFGERNVPGPQGPVSETSPGALFLAWVDILDDILAKQLQGKAVVNLSLGESKFFDSPLLHMTLTDLL